MWGGNNPTAASMNAIYGGGGVPMMMQSAVPTTTTTSSSSGASQQQKNDIFVGNLAFNTTEEQLHTIFSEVGRVINVRMVIDQETGKMRGFAFVEFEQAQDALSAIRNMNEYELNGRKLRVNFSSTSHLEALAGKLGMDIPNNAVTTTSTSISSSGQQGANKGLTGSSMASTTAVADALKGLSKGEMYDVVAKLKEIADRDPDEARRTLAGHPQLPEALLFLMSKLDMIKTPLPSATNGDAGVGLTPSATAATTPGVAAPTGPARVVDPRAVAGATTAVPARIDPRQQAAQQRIDPRQQQRADPRAAIVVPGATPNTAGYVQQQQQQMMPPPQQQLPPPPPQQQQQQYNPPPPPPPPPRMPPPPPQQQQQPPQNLYGQQPQQIGGLNLDPALVQQVLSLTPQQIAQLPIDKQQSIFQLRQQITGQPM